MRGWKNTRVGVVRFRTGDREEGRLMKGLEEELCES